MKRFFLRLVYYPVMTILRVLDMLSPPAYMNIARRFFLLLGVKMNGKPKYISGDVYFDSFSLIELGEDVVISKKVVLLTHDYSITTGLISASKRPAKDVKIIGEIVIGNNVFVGLGTIVLPGTQIGDNCIIGAGCVVKGVIPSNSVLIGNPARIAMSIDQYIINKQKGLDKFTCVMDNYKS